MDLAEALGAALSARYGAAALRGPGSRPDTRQGLMTRLRHIAKAVGGGPLKLARAIGVSPRQLRRWRNEGVKPTPASLRRVERAYAQHVTAPRLAASVKRRKPPTKVNVTAVIRWSNSPRTNYNGGHAGHRAAYRTVKFRNLNTEPVVTAWMNHGNEAAAQAFESLIARTHKQSPGDIGFEGDNVKVEFPR